MKRLMTTKWLQIFGITLVILGLLRLPLPSASCEGLHHQHSAGATCPISAVDRLAENLGPDSNGNTAEPSPWTSLFIVFATESAESKDTNEDCDADSEPLDNSVDTLDSSLSLARIQQVRWTSKDIALSLDSIDSVTSLKAASSLQAVLIRAGICRNGTSPSFGPSLNTLYQRWAC